MKVTECQFLNHSENGHNFEVKLIISTEKVDIHLFIIFMVHVSNTATLISLYFAMCISLELLYLRLIFSYIS